MYYCALSLGVYCSILYSTDFLSLVRFGVFWSTVSVNFLLISKLMRNRRAKLGQIQGGLQRAIQDSTNGGLQ